MRVDLELDPGVGLRLAFIVLVLVPLLVLRLAFVVPSALFSVDILLNTLYIPGKSASDTPTIPQGRSGP